MIYTLSNMFVGEVIALLVLSLVGLLWKRKAIYLGYGIIAVFFAVLFAFLSVRFGSNMIDLVLSRVVLGGYSTPPVGLQVGPMLGGAALAVLVWLVPLWASAEKQRSYLNRSLAGVAALFLVQIVVVRHLTVEYRLDAMSRTLDGLRQFVAQVPLLRHRVLLEPLPRLAPHEFSIVPVATGLDMPVALAFAPDGRLFIGQQDGALLVLKPGEERPEPFYMVENVESRSESGLIDLAFHPDFPAQPYLYAYHTVSGHTQNQVLRLRLEGEAVTAVEVVFDGIPGGTMHNGGALAFGEDGQLYVGTGIASYLSAGRSYTEPPGPRAMDNLFGKILRLTPEGAVPEDNPLSGSPIYARGFREVFRLRHDPLSGRLFATENGSGDHDEINIVEPGGDYGWQAHRGITGLEGLEDPILDILRPIGVTGFEIYDGAVYPEVYRYDAFFCGYVNGYLYWMPLDRDAGSRLPAGPVQVIQSPDPETDCRLDLRQGHDGRLYFSNTTGVYRLDLGPTTASGATAAEALFGQTARAQPAAVPSAEPLDGARLYQQHCAVCHQSSGEGRPGLYPPLVRSSLVVEDAAVPVRIVLSGLVDASDARGESYSAIMPGFIAHLRDEEVAALLTYVREAWGNDAAAVSSELVRQQRSRLRGRTQPWQNAAELRAGGG